MTKRCPIISLLGILQNFHVTIYMFLTLHNFNSKQLAKFSFLAVLLNSAYELCRLSYCMYISLKNSKTTLKQNMEHMGETFMLLALLTTCLSKSLF